MDEKKLAQINTEIADVFVKHGIDSVTERVGILEVNKPLHVLSASTDGIAKCLERRSVEKAAGTEI